MVTILRARRLYGNQTSPCSKAWDVQRLAAWSTCAPIPEKKCHSQLISTWKKWPSTSFNGGNNMKKYMKHPSTLSSLADLAGLELQTPTCRFSMATNGWKKYMNLNHKYRWYIPRESWTSCDIWNANKRQVTAVNKFQGGLAIFWCQSSVQPLGGVKYL